MGITEACGKDAAKRAIPVFPGNKNGFSVLFDLVPSGKIPSAAFETRTSAADANASSPPLLYGSQFVL